MSMFDVTSNEYVLAMTTILAELVYSARVPPAAIQPLVLVVDDYADAREMYVESLLVVGFRVAEAANGVEAVEKARALSPDAILMDLSLPGIDGWEATRQLKADPATSHIPIVAITGHAPAAAEVRARLAGCDRLLIKPALPDQVIAEVRQVLGRHPSL
jgi:two-component system, cell cycle response regulator DivK